MGRFSRFSRFSRFRLIALSLLISFLTITLTPAYTRSEDNQMKAIFMDTFYGMAAGALIASAVSLAQDDPDWGENVGTGAAIGGIAGALFGIATEVRYLASIENGHTSISIPSIGAKMDSKGESPLYTAGVFQYKF